MDYETTDFGTFIGKRVKLTVILNNEIRYYQGYVLENFENNFKFNDRFLGIIMLRKIDVALVEPAEKGRVDEGGGDD
jgi:hypothetical protein